MPLLISPEGRISRNARLVGGQANIGLQPTGLSRAISTFPRAFWLALLRRCSRRTHPAAEPNRWAAAPNPDLCKSEMPCEN